ncbi:MAG: hypothetical protein ABI399_04550 [Bauldia sp.]
MSDSGPAAIPRRIFVYLRALVRFAAFIVLGPLVGWLVVVIGLMLRGVPDDALHALPLSLAYGYAIGAIPAAVAGFVVAVRDVLSRPVTPIFALALGAAVGAIWGVYLASTGAGYVYLGTLAFVGAIVATLACWWVTRGLRREAMR